MFFSPNNEPWLKKKNRERKGASINLSGGRRSAPHRPWLAEINFNAGAYAKKDTAAWNAAASEYTREYADIYYPLQDL